MKNQKIKRIRLNSFFLTKAKIKKNMCVFLGVKEGGRPPGKGSTFRRPPFSPSDHSKASNQNKFTKELRSFITTLIFTYNVSNNTDFSVHI